MKLQFSLAALLVCVTVLAVVCGIASRIRVPVVTGIEVAGSDELVAPWEVYELPTASEVFARVALWGPVALAATLGALILIRRLKSRRENYPPDE